MRWEDLTPEMKELALEHGIELGKIDRDLTDAELEAVVGGKGRRRRGDDCGCC